MITAQIDSFERSMPELVPLFHQHWIELGLFRDRMPLAPQYAEYVRRERAGSLFLTTVRWDGRIAGYQTVQVAPGLHYGSTLTGHTDLYYIPRSDRGRGLVVPLFRTTERELRRRGVKVWYSGYKTHNPLQMPAVLDAFGFVPSDTLMVKWIDT